MRRDYDDIPEFEVVDDRPPLTVQTPPSTGTVGRRRRLGAHTAAQLLVMDLPEVRQIVPGFFSEGLTLFGGKPKIGKSWLLAGTALALAMGGCALGSIAVDEGDVLLLALEDNRRRLKRRLEQLLPNGGNPTRLTIDYDCPRLDAGGLDDIRAWIQAAENPRMVIIDVLNKIRPAQKHNEGIYDYDVRCLEGLQSLAAEFRIAIVVVHHTRKAEAEDPFDCLSGSTGLTGTADTTLVLARDSQGTTLYGRGRDIEEIEKAMSFDRTTGQWSVLGEAAEVRRTDERTILLNALREQGQPMSPADLASATGMKNDSVRQLVLKLVRTGDAEKVAYGQYVASGHLAPHHTVHSDHTYRRAKDGGDHEL